MFWKRKPVAEDIELNDQQCEMIVSRIVSCVPIETRSRWFFNAFEATPEFFAEHMDAVVSADEIRDVYRSSIVSHSWSLFDALQDEDPFGRFQSLDGDDATEVQTLANYMALRETDEEFSSFLDLFSGPGDSRRYVRFPADDLEARINHLLYHLRAQDDDMIASCVDAHAHVLVPEVERLVALNTNRYGKLDPEPAEREIREFWASVSGGYVARSYLPHDFIDATFSYIHRNFDTTSEGAAEPIPSDGIGFEIWCSRALTDAGISNYITQGGGDQGIDVISQINGRRVGIQCKRYAAPVGNKAVQEALAGKSFYGLDVVCVVSTGGYTKAARDLAKRADVILLSERDVTRIADLLD